MSKGVLYRLDAQLRVTALLELDLGDATSNAGPHEPLAPGESYARRRPIRRVASFARRRAAAATPRRRRRPQALWVAHARNWGGVRTAAAAASSLWVTRTVATPRPRPRSPHRARTAAPPRPGHAQVPEPRRLRAPRLPGTSRRRPATRRARHGAALPPLVRDAAGRNVGRAAHRDVDQPGRRGRGHRFARARAGARVRRRARRADENGRRPRGVVRRPSGNLARRSWRVARAFEGTTPTVQNIIAETRSSCLEVWSRRYAPGALQSSEAAAVAWLLASPAAATGDAENVRLSLEGSASLGDMGAAAVAAAVRDAPGAARLRALDLAACLAAGRRGRPNSSRRRGLRSGSRRRHGARRGIIPRGYRRSRGGAHRSGSADRGATLTFRGPRRSATRARRRSRPRAAAGPSSGWA